MKNTFVTLLALGGLTTTLFAFTTSAASGRISITGKDSTADSSFAIDSSFTKDAAFTMDSAAMDSSLTMKADSAARFDSIARLDSSWTADSAKFMMADSAKSGRFDSSRAFAGTQIKGHIDPANAAFAVVAYSSTDSTKVTVTDGSFILNEKPGTYKIIVEANSPFKNAIKEDVQVVDGNVTDLGTIKLQQ